LERFLLISIADKAFEDLKFMKRSLVVALITGSLISPTFFSCSRHDVAQRKNYQEILYGTSGKTEAAPVQPVTEIHVTTSKKAEPISIDTLKFLGQNSLPLFTDNYFNIRIAEKTNLFYRGNKLQTKWLYNNEPSQLYYSLIGNLKNAAVYGLNPEDYSPDLIEKAVQSVYDAEGANAEEVVALDVRITELYFLFTTHLSEGKIRNAGYSDKLWLREQRSKSAVDVAELVEANDPKDLEKIFDRIQPANEQYKRLQSALIHYRNLERYAVESLPTVNLSGKLTPGMRSKAIPLIRRRLSQFDLKVYPITLDSLTGQWDSLLYDKGLAQGVIEFQIIHGLEPDGVLGSMTINYLNKSLRSRVEAIAVNIDRIRWTPELKKDSEYIIVNVPEYKLYIYDKNKEVFEMRVVVGAVENPTPVFNDHINHIVFSPTWTVPVSIIKNEIIPRLISNPDYYTERNYVFYKDGQQIDPASEPWGTTQPHQYRIVQQSGGDNSLGRVKFGMSNSMRIYLHDTPSQRLFAKDYRALSHGCIRLDEPAKFAEYLLRENSGWDKEKINKEMLGGKASTIMLKKDYQVHIQYCTAWVSEDGRMNFREDIYGHDYMQLQELNKPAIKTSGVIAGL
jgi:murein L,D-transpeptidase YcbB/YkuD